ncbi:Response regulator PleD [Fundidesulfovibrio magnetotacticus]|uniref:diguanylate cyclase n=1 Tax=Fundidesulfovibrio magnetotacticus TaxID=2730080 RepID=A0A6V8LN50_9BACT|nr:diguanylate cyclase [Fundidesulfovibrio magnetotacticus]GFK93084.1 Response regulator PleD [Fundidesulfovibrio magnetotacticus]
MVPDYSPDGAPPGLAPFRVPPQAGAHGPFYKVSYAWRWFALLLGLTAFATLIVHNLYKDHRNLLATEKDRLKNQAQVVKQVVATELVALHSVLYELRSEWASGRLREDADSRFKILVGALPGVRDILLFDAGGMVQAVNDPKLLGQNFGGRDYFRRTALDPSPETLHVSRPYRSTQGDWVITVSLRIDDAQGRFIGVIAATLDPAYFSPLLDSMLHAPDMWAMLVHGQGTVFLTAPHLPETDGRGLERPDTLFSRHLASGGRKSVFLDIMLATGKRELVAFQTISPPALNLSHPLVVAVARDPEVILAGWRTSVIRYGGAFGLLALASSMGLALYQRSRRQYDRLRESAAQALVQSEHFLRTLTDNIPGMVGYWDNGLRCRYANPAYRNWFGRSPEQMLGIHIRELLGGKLYSKNERYILAALRGEPQQFERTLVRSDGSVGHTLVHYIPDEDAGRVRGFYVLVFDVSELKVAQHQLEELVKRLEVLATTDSLTGMANRRRLLERCAEEHARAARYAQPLSFLMMDIDHFKHINDSLGHDVGDEVLKAVAQSCAEALRATDVLGRLGGEEFGVLLPQTATGDARAVAERLRRFVESLVATTRAGTVRVTVSVGFSTWRETDHSAEDMMRRADAGLYEAKRAGRNCVREG